MAEAQPFPCMYPHPGHSMPPYCMTQSAGKPPEHRSLLRCIGHPRCTPGPRYRPNRSGSQDCKFRPDCNRRSRRTNSRRDPSNRPALKVGRCRPRCIVRYPCKECPDWSRQRMYGIGRCSASSFRPRSWHRCRTTPQACRRRRIAGMAYPHSARHYTRRTVSRPLGSCYPVRHRSRHSRCQHIGPKPRRNRLQYRRPYGDRRGQLASRYAACWGPRPWKPQAWTAVPPPTASLQRGPPPPQGRSLPANKPSLDLTEPRPCESNRSAPKPLSVGVNGPPLPKCSWPAPYEKCLKEPVHRLF